MLRSALIAVLTVVLSTVLVTVPEAVARAAAAGDGLALWYDEPATDWESQALPIGNGALGAKVFGTVEDERLQFNEKSLWTGGPGSREGYNHGNWDQPRPGAVDQVQRDLAAKGQLDPQAVVDALGQPKKGYGGYQNFGELSLKLTRPPAQVQEYRRTLDIARSVATVSYVADGVRYTREYFASNPGGVIVARLSANKPDRISFITSVKVPDGRSGSTEAADGRITTAGELNDNGLKYESQAQVRNQGGTRQDSGDGTITVNGANSAVVTLGAGTDYADHYPDYRGENPHERITFAVDKASAQSYQDLLRTHENDHKALFDRVALDLGQQKPDMPTDELLKQYQTGNDTADRALEALFFQYGRYLLISSSRAGSLPANLQGVWNNSADAPWGSDYHTNINLQMNYWLAETTNLGETTTPLFDHVDALRAPGRVTAAQMFGHDGWVVQNETTPYGYTGVHDYGTAFWFPEAGAWLARHYFEHFRFTHDEKFLHERAYPMLRELSEFWLQELVVDKDGKLVVSPSYSPEHGPFSAGASMSQQIVWDLLTNTAEAAQVTGDTAFRDRMRDTLAKLDPGTRVGAWGQLQEWKQDWDDPSDQHRHVSHLYGLHPGRQISPTGTPDLAAAAKRSLHARGDGGTGWSKAWKINFWARLLDGNRAHKLLGEQLRTSTLSNLWDTHPPFQIDGNFGATSGMTEMLLQSQRGEIHALPAVPAAWDTGSVSGLRARGDVTVDLHWSSGRAREIALTTGHSGPLAVRNTMFDTGFQLIDSTSRQLVEPKRDGELVTFDAQEGHRYVATPKR